MYTMEIGFVWQNFLGTKFHPPEHILSLLDVLLHNYVIKDDDSF